MAVGIGTIGGGILVEHVVQGQVCSVVVGTGSLANGRGRAWWIVFICQGSSCLHNEKIDIKSVAVYIDFCVLISRRNRSYAFPGAGKCVPRLESRANNPTSNVSGPPGALFAILPLSSLFATPPEREITKTTTCGSK